MNIRVDHVAVLMDNFPPRWHVAGCREITDFAGLQIAGAGDDLGAHFPAAISAGYAYAAGVGVGTLEPARVASRALDAGDAAAELAACRFFCRSNFHDHAKFLATNDISAQYLLLDALVTGSAIGIDRA
jgi:hypothetical protein